MKQGVLKIEEHNEIIFRRFYDIFFFDFRPRNRAFYYTVRRSAGLQSRLQICAFGLRAVRKPFGALVYTRLKEYGRPNIW